MFEIGDKVEWFDFVGSMVKNYGTIINLTPKFADIRTNDQIIRVRQSLLNWS